VTAELNKALDRAIALHQGGDPIAAEPIYRELLAAAPLLADVHYLLGMACLQQGKSDKAIRSLRSAISQKPDRADWHFNLGIALRQSGELAVAAKSFAKAAQLHPPTSAAHAAAVAEEGAVLLASGDLPEAEERLRRAVLAGNTEARRNLAICLYNQSADMADPTGVMRLTEAMRLLPDRLEIQERLGLALLRSDRAAEALACFQSVLTRQPGELDSWIGLCDALVVLGRFDEAVMQARAILARFPNLPAGLVVLAAGLHGLGRLDEAAQALEHSLLESPDLLAALVNLGTVRRDQGDDAGAEECYQAALTLAPDDPIIHWQRAQARLLAGDMSAGWQEYEWRWRVPGFPLSQVLADLPLWCGERLAEGRRLLVHAEQGHGDSLQFVRYVHLLAERGVPVLLQVQPALQRLFRDSLPVVVEVGVLGQGVPCDIVCRCPLLSLPFRFDTSLQHVPANIPYLYIPPERRESWRARVAALPGPKVGLVWAGDSRATDPRAAATDRRRSVAPGQFAPLLDIGGVSFVSLQKRARVAAGSAGPVLPGLVDWTDELIDFADTAALVANLDLVIGVDTAVIHLAGGLGVPVWVLSRFDGCWRWLRDRTDSPWYPSLRLFRQAEWGAWGPVVDELVQTLDRVLPKRI
jgi:tetratricopeptide (TPR) repeat protein